MGYKERHITKYRNAYSKKCCIAHLILLSILPTFLFGQAKSTTNHIEELILSNQIDSIQLALKLSKEKNEPALIEKSLGSIIDYHLEIPDFNSAILFQLQLESHFIRYPDKQKEANLYLSMGATYLEEKYPEKALQYLLKSEPNLPKSKSQFLYDKIVTSYNTIGKIDSALIYLHKRIKLYEGKNKINKSIQVRQEIASLLAESGRHQKALDQNFLLKDIAEQTSNRNLEANIQNNIGNNYNALKDYNEALKYFQFAEKTNKKKNYLNQSVLFTNIGIVYSNLGDMKNAIAYLLKSEKDLIKRKEKSALANLYHLISTIYYTNGDIYNALTYSIQSIDLAKMFGDRESLKENYLTSALIYQDLYEYEKALSSYQKHLDVRDSILLEERLEKQSIIQQKNQLEKSEKELKLLLANQEVQDLIINQLELEKEKLNLSSEKLKLEAARKASELELLKKEQEVTDSKFRNQELVAQQAKQELALSEQKLNNQIAIQKLNEAKQKEKLAKVELEKNEALKKEREKEISILTLDKEILTKDKLLLTNEQRINQLQLTQDAAFRNTAYIVGGLLSAFGLIFLYGFLNFRKKNQLLGIQKSEIEQQKKEIEDSNHLIAEEKSKSDALLLNILPKETASELKESGIATPKEYKEVSVLFTDFSKFTNLSEGLSADELIAELNQYFLAFDEICEKYNIEKIKTIGDSYMCASGLPIESRTHALDLVAATKEMQAFVANNNRKRRALNLAPWEMRAGIHSGPVIAGVVGSKKFTYDIWGDTVNTASRMESAGALGQINISSTTYELVKHKVACTNRGKIEAKNKGLLEMYQVDMD